MNIQFSSELNYFFESMAILSKYCENPISGYKPFEEIFEKNTVDNNFPNELLLEMFAPIIEIKDFIMEQLCFDKSRWDYLFNARFLEKYSIATTITNNINTIEELEYYCNLDSDQLKKYMISTIYEQVSDYNVSYNESLNLDYETFFKFLKEADISDQNKWDYIVILNEIKTFLNELLEVIKQVSHLLQLKKDITVPLIEKYYSEVKNLILQNGYEYIEKVFCVNVNLKEVQVNPSIMLCNGANFYKSQNSARYHMHVGVLYITLINLRKEYSKEFLNINTCLKLLGDKRKFDILCAIKEKPMYGLEIANMFSLTAATISHHMNALLQAGLVTVETDDNKIIYSLNKNAVADLLSDLNKRFL